MIVDTSAVVAIVRSERERPNFLRALLENDSRMSAATYLECGSVLDRGASPAEQRQFDKLIRDFEINVVDFTAEQARIAREAYRDFGKGSGHRARLNFGDCFAYALSSVTDEPLLYKGDEFGHTDVRSAV